MMSTIGLTAATVIYQFLHESGHSVAALIVGGKIVEYHLFPIPYVLCDVGKVTLAGQAFIEIG